jgi:serine/threonine-protein kinase
VDFEIAMNRCVHHLRTALRDDTEAPRYIRTIPRIGYKFVAPVTVVTSATAPESETPKPASAVPLSSTGEVKTDPSIVVLPFANLTNLPEDESFSDGLTEEIINALAQVPGLKVIARTSAFAFKGKNEDVRLIGKTLGVTKVLEGSVRRAGARVRITVQLISTHDGTHLSSKRYDHELSDIFAVQDEIASDIADQLKLRVALRKRATTSVEAYAAFQEARLNWHKITPEGYVRALECYQRAIAIDPKYAPAYAGIAECYTGLAMNQAAPPLEVMPKGLVFAQKALELDETVPEAHAAIGRVAGIMDHDWPEAERHYRRARELNPTSHVRLSYAVWYLAPQCRIAEAIAECEQVIAQDPLLSIARTGKAQLLILARDFARAAECCLRVLEIDGTFPHAHQLLAHLYALQGMPDQALKHAKRLQELPTNAAVKLSTLGGVYAWAAQASTAHQIVEQMCSTPELADSCALNIGSIYALLGEKQQALPWLERAVAYRDPRTLWLGSFPWADSLRREAGFMKLLSEMNLKPCSRA